MPDALITAACPLLDGALDVLLDSRQANARLPRAGAFGEDRVLDLLPMLVYSLPR